MLRRFLFALVVALACAWRGWCASVAVVHGNLSVPESERRFARVLAQHVERWYGEQGVPFDASDDRALAKTLRDKKFAVLVYCSQPTAAQLADLKAFVARGGKLAVFYSSSPGLASLMGVRPLGYKKSAPGEGRWSQMFFTEKRPKGAPLRITQTSPNIFAAEPLAGSKTEVMAWWLNRSGQRTEAAWLAGPAGYWMTHVFTADGDEDGKRMLLLAMAAESVPGVWQQAAVAFFNAAGKIEANQRLSRAVAALPASPRRKQAEKTLREAEGAKEQARRLIGGKEGYAALIQAQGLRQRYYEVYGLAQLPKTGEIRAVWDHSGQGLYPGDWGKTCRLLSESGITDLFVNVAGSAFAHYESRVLPRSAVCEAQGDQLAACIKAARKHGLRVHAWMLCFSTEGATADRLAAFRKKGWLLTDETGKQLNWVDPANPEVRAYLANAALEMATRYKVDGIHLDFIRYANFNSALGAETRRRFEGAIKRKVASWPSDVQKGGDRATFVRWRAERVTDAVETIRRRLKKEAPGVLLSTAVYGKYPSCVDAVGQDWESWLRLGLIDYILPMNYTENLDTFDQWLARQTENPRYARKMIAGIGVTAAESRLDPIQVIDQIRQTRQRGAAGFALFDLDLTLRQEVLPVLKLGISAKKE